MICMILCTGIVIDHYDEDMQADGGKGGKDVKKKK